MNYSRRQLYELGEPFGESATRLKVGGRIYGGGSSTPTDTKQTTVTELPEWAKPYAKDILSKGSALTDISQNPYQTYGGARQAGFSPLQTQAMTGAQNMQTPEQGQAGTALSAISGLGGLNVAGQANTQGFQNQVGGYMNPYLQYSLAPQLAEANRQYDISGTRQQSAATQAGAFGGSREAIMAAENERNRNMGLQNIVGQGYNQAFGQAQQQYNQNLGTQLQGFGMANAAAGQLGQLGGQQFQQGLDINKLQSGYGAMQQAQQQQGLDTAYQDFQNQKNYPYRQLGYMSDLLRGTPTGSSGVTNMYAPPANVAGQIAGLGIGAMGLSKFMAEGGMADGGPSSVEDPQNIQEIVSKLSDAQLLQSLKAAMQRGDAMQIDAIKQEQAMRASERNGLASTVTPQMTEDMMPSAANGGIVAFADEGLVEDPQFGGSTSTYEPPEKLPMSQVQSIVDSLKSKGKTVGLSDVQDIMYGKGAFSKEVASFKEKPKPNQVQKLTQEELRAMQQAHNSGHNSGQLPFDKSTATRKEDFQTAGGGKKKGLGDALALDQAVQNVAQNAGVPQRSLREEAMDILKDLKSMNKEDYKAMNDAIENKKGDADKIKAKGLSEALMQFGFGMAANAAKPGAKFFGSAAGAAPILGQVASENEKLQRAASDNYMKLKMDQTRYQVALDKGDMQTATALATQIRTGDMQQKQLDALVKYQDKALAIERQKLGVTAAAYAPQAIREAEMLMARTPGLSFQDAYKQATRQRDASENAAGARDRAALAKGLMDLNKEHKKESMIYPANSKEAKNMLNRHEVEKKLLHESLGFQYGGGGGGGATLNPDLFQVKPVK